MAERHCAAHSVIVLWVWAGRFYRRGLWHFLENAHSARTGVLALVLQGIVTACILDINQSGRSFGETDSDRKEHGSEQ